MTRVGEAVAAYTECSLFRSELEQAEQMVHQLESCSSTPAVDGGTLRIPEHALRTALHSKLNHITANCPRSLLEEQHARLEAAGAARDTIAKQVQEAVAKHIIDGMTPVCNCLGELLAGGHWPKEEEQCAQAEQELTKLPAFVSTHLDCNLSARGEFQSMGSQRRT